MDDRFPGLDDRLRQKERILLICLQQMKSDPLRRFPADPGDPRQPFGVARRDGGPDLVLHSRWAGELRIPAPPGLEIVSVNLEPAATPEQLAALLREIRDRPPQMDVEVQTKWQLADTPRDAWLFFVALVVLLTGEWFLRKKWGLV